MEQSGAGAIPKKPTEQFVKNVILLKNCDFQRGYRGQVIMPTQSEISIIRARAAGQYKKDVEFHARMSEDMVKRKLEETFPYLENKGFVCAAKVYLGHDYPQFDFHGTPHVWDGKTIRRNIRGNSTLYVLEDGDQMDTSGISESDPEFTQDQFVKDVVLLTNGDFQRVHGEVLVPVKMARTRTRAGLCKKDIEFHARMSEDTVKRKLEETFPYLKNKRYFCAAKVNPYNDSSEFDFLGTPRLWDGRTIKRRIQGNSILYILEDDQMDTGGISGRDPESSQDDLQQKGSEIGNISKTLSQMTLREETKDEDEESTIIRATMEFEAKHEECLLVYPYKNNGKVVVHLYVYMDRSAIPPALKTAAQEFFGPMEVKLEWSDLYNDAYNVLNVTSIEYPSGEPNRLKASQVDEIDEIINKNLHVFSKHRNITAVQPSFKVTNSVQTEEACITVYVLGKGNIPLGESAILGSIGGFPVDVVNGFFFRTAIPYRPINAHKQKEYLCSGASIGVNGEKSSGTLGAIVEDKNTGTLYALSCDHVMKHAQKSEITYPGFDIYLNSLQYHLTEYHTLVSKIKTQEKLSDEILGDSEKIKIKFNSLKDFKESNSQEIHQGELNSMEAIEKEFYKFFAESPRIIGNYSVGIKLNVESEQKAFFIDAAISKLKEEEVNRFKWNGSVEIVDSALSPSRNCVVATMQKMSSVEHLCKSGSGTGFTETDKGLSGSEDSSILPPMYINNGPDKSPAPWFDLDPAAFVKKQAQSQPQESPSLVEICKPYNWLKRCLCISGKLDKPFSDVGDSGAVVFEKIAPFCPGLGIIFGKHASSHHVFSLASPLKVALEKLSQKVSTRCELRLASNERDVENQENVADEPNLL